LELAGRMPHPINRACSRRVENKPNFQNQKVLFIFEK